MSIGTKARWIALQSISPVLAGIELALIFSALSLTKLAVRGNSFEQILGKFLEHSIGPNIPVFLIGALGFCWSGMFHGARFSLFLRRWLWRPILDLSFHGAWLGVGALSGLAISGLFLEEIRPHLGMLFIGSMTFGLLGIELGVALLMAKGRFDREISKSAAYEWLLIVGALALTVMLVPMFSIKTSVP
ncbi:MAG: hypothetical protein EG824_00405 [Deltaproteobacteria bacterium]|nr:hypothetical protein [Deltaproteobacteria bacterium]